MTREQAAQAAEVLKAYRNRLTNAVSNQLDGDIQAFDMAIQAIQALQAQTEKTCDLEKSNFSKEQYKLDTDTAYECGYNAGLQAQADGEYISRQAVIDAIDKWVKNMGVLIALPVSEVTPLFDSIHKLPSVKPQEPKTGQWIDKGSLSCRCDQCGCKNNRETKFCPNCGADMRETDNMASDKLTTDDGEPDGTGGQIFCP